MGVLSPAATATATIPPPYAFQKFNPKNPPSLISLSSSIDPRRPFLPSLANPDARTHRLPSALSPQPPAQPDPPPEKDPVRHKGIAASFSRFQDRVQIFFAVLFWMSLFFWASAWDGRNNGSGRPKKGSKFRR